MLRTVDNLKLKGAIRVLKSLEVINSLCEGDFLLTIDEDNCGASRAVAIRLYEHRR